MTTLHFSDTHPYPYYWTDEQIQVLLGCYKTATLDEMARLLGRSQHSIKNKIHGLRVAGIIQGPRKSWGRPSVCKYCSITFIPSWAAQKYCSKRHKSLWARERYYSQHPEMMRVYGRRNHRKIRDAALIHYGSNPPRCACCGEGAKEFLVIDHINNDGSKHRRTFKGARQIYQWLKNNSYPDGFQVLCHNCNFAKSHYPGCPHQSKTPEGFTTK